MHSPRNSEEKIGWLKKELEDMDEAHF